MTYPQKLWFAAGNKPNLYRRTVCLSDERALLLIDTLRTESKRVATDDNPRLGPWYTCGDATAAQVLWRLADRFAQTFGLSDATEAIPGAINEALFNLTHRELYCLRLALGTQRNREHADFERRGRLADLCERVGNHWPEARS